MATFTPLLNLRKADPTEFVQNILDINENMDKLDTLGSVVGGGAWTPYVPVWGSTGTPPALGNGTLVGSYHQVGKTVDIRVKLVPGSTSSYGTGNWNFTLPAGMVGKDALRYYSAGGLIQAAGFFLMMAIVNDTNIFSIMCADNTIGNVSNISSTHPQAWGSGNIVDVNMRIEIL